jgi:hypothetical protein
VAQPFLAVRSAVHFVTSLSFQEIIMNKSKHSRSRVATDESSLCQFSFADGRNCRMFRQQDHPSLCVFHAWMGKLPPPRTKMAQEVQSDAVACRRIAPPDSVR